MDAVKYLKEYDRMCKSYGVCENCEIDKLRNKCEGCSSIVYAHPEKVVDIVEKWSAEHPVKTRQSEFLKMFPNAKLDANSVSTICPRSVDTSIPEGEICDSMTCSNCRKEYWFAEVE